jgi:hypothetical protein
MAAVTSRLSYYIRQATRTVLSIVEAPPSRHTYSETRQHDIQAEIARLKAEFRTTMPDNLLLAGYKVFSQGDEDGIIQALLDGLPPEQLSHTAIEIGCGDGRENNTHLLLLKGFRVCWLDGNPANIATIRQELGMEGESKGRLMVSESFVTRDNIAGLIDRFCTFLGTTEPDFFSLDIDGNDLYVLGRAMETFRPKIVCVEYNGKFPPPLKLSIRYNPQHEWSGDDYQGASLQAFCDLLSDYELVCCNILGSNAFFVEKRFGASYPSYAVSALYQPLRSHLRLLAAGHPPSLKWARDLLSVATK